MKKFFAVALAMVMALSCMMVAAFAEEIVLFESEAGDALGTDAPWAGIGIGKVLDGRIIGDMTWDEFTAFIKNGGTKLVIVWSYTTGNWNDCMQSQFNCWDDEENLQVNPEVTELGDGKYMSVLNIDDCIAKLEAVGGSVDTANNFGVQIWVDGCLFHSVKLLSADESVEVEIPTNFETSDNETPADDTNEEVSVENPVGETETAEETTPAETGIALAVVPMVVAAAVVAVSKRR